MTTTANPYESLYSSLKANFTYTEDGYECTLGESMLIRAGANEESSSSTLALARVAPRKNAVNAIVSYVSTQLSVADAPVRNKTLRRFPLKTSMSAAFSAVAACALVFSCGIFALKGASPIANYTANSSGIEIVTPADEAIESDELQLQK